MKLTKLIGCFVPCGAGLAVDETAVQVMVRELEAELDQLFPELRPRPLWKRAKEAIRRRRNGAKVAPATADDDVIVLGPAVTRMLVSRGNTQLLEELESHNQATRQYYAS